MGHLNAGGFECLTDLGDTVVEISSDEEEEPFVKPEPGSNPAEMAFNRPTPLVEELVKIRWMGNSLLPVCGEKWIGVKNPFRHEKYALFRTMEGAKRWALSLVESARHGLNQTEILFADGTLSSSANPPVDRRSPPMTLSAVKQERIDDDEDEEIA